MAVNAVKIWHGWSLYISNSAATAASTGTTGHTKVGSVVNVGGDFGPKAKEAVSEPLDATAVIIRKGILDYGTAEFIVDRDDDDAGQTIVNTASKANSTYGVLLSDGTSSIGFLGYVTGDSNPGGAGGDFIRRKMMLRLTADVA